MEGRDSGHNLYRNGVHIARQNLRQTLIGNANNTGHPIQ